jgi:hypothetical protein
LLSRKYPKRPPNQPSPFLQSSQVTLPFLVKSDSVEVELKYKIPQLFLIIVGYTHFLHQPIFVRFVRAFIFEIFKNLARLRDLSLPNIVYPFIKCLLLLFYVRQQILKLIFIQFVYFNDIFTQSIG